MGDYTEVKNFFYETTSKGIRVYRADLEHSGLEKYRRLRGFINLNAINNCIKEQCNKWDADWAEYKKLNSYTKKSKEYLKSFAEQQTKEDLFEMMSLELMLFVILSDNSSWSWTDLKVELNYPTFYPRPYQRALLPKPPPKELPAEPKVSWSKYKPDLSFFDHLLPFRKNKVINERLEWYEADHKVWEQEIKNIEAENLRLDKDYSEYVANAQSEYQKILSSWNEEIQRLTEYNLTADKFKASYLKKDPDAISEYCWLLLNNSGYPDYFPMQFDIEYIPQTKILLINYALPSKQDLPKFKEYNYIQSKNCVIGKPYPDTKINKLYEGALYQTALRTLYEIFTNDNIEAIESIAFNGYVRSIDRSTGREINPCIMSIMVKRSELDEIDLFNVDPKMCFKRLKGVGSSQLYTLTPIAPILTSFKKDRRFVDSYSVSDQLDDAFNLAAMDWEDFEHLIRELFAQEFSSTGCDVHITQASRDGGVDAIAYNPDPIHGGKTVIQAKRYTNTVGVSAVRDLYGTVMNEGANKGILVTTSDYGPDAYSFANGKPLTLLNGGNLLYLLEKHGHKARIDLMEAKRTASS